MESKSEDALAAFQCGGSWDSVVSGSDDGTFISLAVAGSGKITGRHKPRRGTEKNINDGKCEQLADGTQQMTLVREEGGVVYEYVGTITSLGGGRFRAEGTRSSNFLAADGKDVAEAASQGRAKPPDDEQWVATRPPT